MRQNLKVTTVDKSIMVDLTSTNKNNDSKVKYPSFLKNFRYYLIEYSENTSIHGIKLLCEQKRSILERLWWLIFLSVSLYFCVYLIIDTYKKWERSPVFVTLATSQTLIRDIPFPAVTVCPKVKTDILVFNLTELIEQCDEGNLTETQKEYAHYMSLTCSYGINDDLFENCRNDNESYFTTNKPAHFFLEKRQYFWYMAHLCYWSGVECTVGVDKLFIPIVTREGVCFSFNMLDRDEIYTSENIKDYYENLSIPHQPQSTWSLESGYRRITANFSSFPRRTRTSGIVGGLELLFKLDFFELNYNCGDMIQGYKIIIHNPGQIPDTGNVHFYVGLDRVVLAAVKPNLITTSNELQDYTPKDRECYFKEERSLKFFKVYDQQNCLLECLTNFTYEVCRCVDFYMPRNASMNVCAHTLMQCISDAKDRYVMDQDDINTEDAKNDCNCLPACTSLNYEAEISDTYWNLKDLSKKRNSKFDTSAKHSLLRIYFKDVQFVTYKRKELYGQTDFLASCGGLLGLFTGFSFISIAEILYFATLKLFCNLCKFGRHYWAGTP